MRSVSSTFLTNFNLPIPEIYLLAEINTPSPVRLTSWPSNLVYNGSTYYANSAIVGFGSPRVSSSVDREIYELVIADQTNQYQALWRNGMTGCQLTVYLGTVNSAGFPVTDVSNVIIAYRGVIDNLVVTNDLESKFARFQAGSPMVNLDAVSGVLVCKDGIRRLAAPPIVDTSFDEVIVNAKEVTLHWGKI